MFCRYVLQPRANVVLYFSMLQLGLTHLRIYTIYNIHNITPALLVIDTEITNTTLSHLHDGIQQRRASDLERQFAQRISFRLGRRTSFRISPISPQLYAVGRPTHRQTKNASPPRRLATSPLAREVLAQRPSKHLLC